MLNLVSEIRYIPLKTIEEQKKKYKKKKKRESYKKKVFSIVFQEIT